MKRREIAVLFQFLIDRFIKDEKRLPFHARDLKEFFQRKGQPLDISEFYFLEIWPISGERVRIEYSVKKNTRNFYGLPEYSRESIEITGSFGDAVKTSELFPEPKLEWPLKELWDVS